MTIGVLRERAEGERRVALVPAHVPVLEKLGAAVQIEADAGRASGFPDARYTERGARVVDRATVLQSSDIVLSVRAGAANTVSGAEDARALREDATLVALLDPWQPAEAFTILADRRIRCFSLEKIPRITRAQSMDVLSSQANLAGYRAVLLAAQELPRMFPMMMTAAGTIVPAKVLIVGVGVAGLQAIATARRLGSVVSAYDIRPAVKEQVESLGARFVEMELETDSAEGSGGYAREMDEAFYRRQRELMASVIAEHDVVITTALIPGKPAPTLVTAEMVRGMQPGSVVVDLAAERGGNCELTRPGERVDEGGVTVVGPLNIASGIANTASQLFSKNVASFLTDIISDGAINADPADEIVAATLVLGDGGAPDRALAETLGVTHTGHKE